MRDSLSTLARNARQASRLLARTATSQRNDALLAMADALLARQDNLLHANSRDVAQAAARGLAPALQDRLALTPERIGKMAQALRDVAALPDPVGEMAAEWTRPNGIRVGQMRVPLGVICMIYEARPNVTSDAAGLCLKAGNATILRGGSEAFLSNQAVVAALHEGLERAGLPAAAVAFVPTTDRDALTELLTFTDYIDLVIPRGGEGLIRFVDEHSRIPVIKHYKGVCHLFVDDSADFDVAMRLLVDGKTSRPGVCNALETLLVHEAVADDFLPRAARLLGEKGVELRGDDATRARVPHAAQATEDDYHAEYLDLILAVRVVAGLDEAIGHVERYGSLHTEVIVTATPEHARRWVREVDASVVMVNASSRFSDGGELGLGAEIGISTTKLHAYGPMGLESLTTRKFVVHGDGQVRV